MSKASVCVVLKFVAMRFALDLSLASSWILCKKYAALAADTNTAHKKYCTPQTKYEMGKEK